MVSKKDESNYAVGVKSANSVFKLECANDSMPLATVELKFSTWVYMF